MTLEEVSRATHIRVHYLEAIETGDWSRIPSLAQGRGFARLYANYLGINPAQILGEIDQSARVDRVQSGDHRDGQPADQLQTSAAEPGEAQSGIGQQPPGREPPAGSAAAIFNEIGANLRQQRELLGLSLDDVVRHTHLRRHYLAALEAGDITSLPSPVQGRGMLNNYATFLGLDPDPLLLRFAEGLQARLAARRAEQVQTGPKRPARSRQFPPALRRIFSSDLLIGGLLGVFLVGFVVWGAIRIFSFNTNEPPTPTAPPIAEVLLSSSELATPSPSPEPLPSETLAAGAIPPGPDILATEVITAAQVTLPPAGSRPVQVYVTANQRAWMRVVVDGDVEFEGRVLPGSAYSFSGDEQVEILTGNGAALNIFFNQEDQGAMGNYGQVVNRIYTIDGVLAPTPTITPTGTPTPRTSATPPPSVTPAIIEGTPVIPALP